MKVPEGDIFVRGYFCRSWIPVLKKRKVYASCDTVNTTLPDFTENDIDYEVVHVCGDGQRCELEDDSQWDDSSSDESASSESA